MILIALGSNLPSRYGSPRNTVVAAIEHLNVLGVQVLDASNVWETAPVPASNQPNYANAVVSVRTSLSPEALLTLLNALEADFGRMRGSERNEARILDLDIIAYLEMVIDEEGIQIPHPRMHERGFVLYPLAEIAPKWVHPALNKSLSTLIDSLETDQILSSPKPCAA